MSLLPNISAVASKEFKQLSRDRLTFGMVVMIPLIQLLLFGYAINTNVRHIPVAVFDQAQSSSSRLLMQAVQASNVVKIAGSVQSVKDAEEVITAGDVRAVLIIPADLEQRLIQARVTQGKAEGGGEFLARPLAQWLVDGSDTIVASKIMRLREMPLSDFTRGPSEQAPPTLETVLYFNPEQRSAVNIVPGLLAIILTMTMILFTSLAIVRERERGNLELLITTPVQPLELMLGKILPYMLIGLIQMMIILGLGHWVFDVPINGDLIQVTMATLLFIAASLTLGLIISTLAKTQLQAMQMTVFILMPSILLSGFVFPYEGMPRAAQYIAEVLPATHFVRMIRAVVLRAARIHELPYDALFLAGFTIAGIAVATLRFNKRLE